MEQRYATSPDQLPLFDTTDLRERFLVPDVFVSGEVTAFYTHHDRIILGGAVPAGTQLALPTPAELHAAYFLENRELGIINVGGAGTVTADGRTYELPTRACLYVGRGTRAITFADAETVPEDLRELASEASRRATTGAQFYLFSAPAHTTYPTTLVLPDQGTVRELGDQVASNRRTLTQYIHENGVQSCQVVMGVTQLHPGSMWNTMPAHTHDRRTECYLYFDLPEDARVIHLMGEPSETRHVVVADRQAVISPSWSVHSGVGTAAYSFIWAMAGENKSFDDMDPVPPTALS